MSVIDEIADERKRQIDEKGFTPHVGIKRPAVLFRGRVYVGLTRHNDAIEAAFSGLTEREKRRAGNRIADGKEELIFGFAFEDGDEFSPTENQESRKVLYGFE